MKLNKFKIKRVYSKPISFAIENATLSITKKGVEVSEVWVNGQKYIKAKNK